MSGEQARALWMVEVAGHDRRSVDDDGRVGRELEHVREPAGICDVRPPPAAISSPSLRRLGSPSCRPVPFGPMREKRNGGAAEALATARAVSRPSPLSASRPSPTTK